MIMNWRLLIISFVVIGCKGTGNKDSVTSNSAIKTSTSCIEQIMEQDSVLGNIRNHSSEMGSLSDAITDYTQDLEALDYSQCPEAFTKAFQQHIDAWKKVTLITDKYPALRGELHDIFSELEKSKDSVEFKALVKEVWDTWALVEESKK